MQRFFPVISCCAAFLSCSGLALAQSESSRASTLELALSNDTLQLRYAGAGNAVGANDAQLNGAIFLGEDRDLVLSAGLLFPAGIDLGRLQIGVGPQVYAALLDEENNDVLSIAIGTELRFRLTRQLWLSGQAFYGPDILTFGTADNLTDLSARVEFRASDRITALAGMRWFEFDLTEGGGEQTLMEEVFAGIAYRF